MSGASMMSSIPFDSMMATNYDTWNHGSVTKKKNVSQEGIDKIVYDIMSSDQGLAALGSGENSSGGFGSASKTLLAQDMMTKLAGEIALVTAEETTSTDMNSDKESPGFKQMGKLGDKAGTVICTELVRQGAFPKELYDQGHEHFLTLSSRTVQGYQVWGKPIAAKMRTSRLLSACMFPIVLARYEQIVNGKVSTLGTITIYLGQPVCFLIGLSLEVLSFLKGKQNGNVSA